MDRKLCLLLFSIALVGLWQLSDADVIEITDDNYSQIREGEWMIKFHAPWCPACQQFAAPWISLEKQIKATHPNVKFAKVDVTVQTSLSGRFLIQALPTIFHVKDGEVRKYAGTRSEDDVKSFVTGEEWRKTDPANWLLSPLGPSGALLGQVVTAGNYLQNLYNTLTVKQGLPVWLVISCAIVTVITSGVLIGLAIVLFFSPSGPPAQDARAPARGQAPQAAEDSSFGSIGENDEVDRKRGASPSLEKPEAKASPQMKSSPSAAAAKASPSAATASPGGARQRKKGKSKASTG